VGLLNLVRSLSKSRAAGGRLSVERVCRFEELEPRIALSATPGPEIVVGATYAEQSMPESAGDRFEVAWVGGAPGTQLTQLTISGDQDGSGGLSIGDVFFDTDGNAPGVNDFSAFNVLPESDITAAQIQSMQITHGGTTLVLTISGWDAGERLVFTIDVDEQDNVPNTQVEGAEFEPSHVTASFVTPDGSYQDLSSGGTPNGVYHDGYTLHAGVSALLTADSGTQENDPRAGLSFTARQTPNPVHISGNVYHDFDVDGNRDGGEVTVTDSGGNHLPVELELFIKDGSNWVSTGLTTFTDTNGDYSFTYESPGEFQVRETQPDGYFSTTPNVVTTPFVGPGQSSTGNDFGEALPGTLSGHVYHDLDDDGSFDTGSGETGINGVTVTLRDSAGNLIGADTTDANGFYEFTGLDPTGVYTITEAQPGGYIDGKDTLGTAGGNDSTNDVFREIAFTHSGDSGSDYDFGELQPASIAGKVFLDKDGDCEQQDGEPGLAGVLIELLDGNGSPVLDGSGNPITALTDSNGDYHFDNLDPRLTYQIKENQPAGYLDSGEEPGTAGGVVLVNDIISEIRLDPGEHATDYHFCENEPPSLAGKVFLDKDGDCEQQDGEPGIAGVLIELLDGSGNPVLDSSGNPITTLTDANGEYRFDNLLPGVTYQIKENQPAGYLDSGEEPGTAGGAVIANDLIGEIVLDPGEHATDYHFCENEPPSLAGKVFLDRDGDCDEDPGEPGLAGVLIELLDGSGNPVLDGSGNPITTLTDANGEYRFDNLLPGVTYQIRENQPAQYLDSGEEPGTAGGAVIANDLIGEIVLDPGEHATEYHFCEQERPSISGYVFQDGPPVVLADGQSPSSINPYTLRDGVRTPDDTPLAGVVLRLGDADGNFLTDGGGNFIQTTTDANGFYQFTGLDADTYTVFQIHPSGYLDSIDTPGTTGGTAANPTSLGNPDLVGITHNMDAIAKITVTAGQHSQNNNFSEVTYVELPPPPPPPPPPVPPSTPPLTVLPTTMGPGPGLAPPLPPPGGGAANIVFYGGGAPISPLTPGYTFHLSVTDAGRPRGEFQTAALTTENAVRTAGLLNHNVFSEEHARMDGAHWLFAKSQTAPVNVQYIFGSPDGIPVTGDFNGDGTTEAGIYRRGEWFIDVNGNGVWDENDLYCLLGSEKELPVTGDWDGDGKTDIGIFGPEWATDPRAVMVEPGLPDRANESPRGAKHNLPPPLEMANAEKRILKFTAAGRERADVIDHVFYYGKGTDLPVAGDWNGDGVATIGVFSGGQWILDDNGDGRWLPGETMVNFGQAGDIPVVGDWDGDGVDDLGVYRQGKWILDTNGNRTVDASDRVEQLGGAGDKPVVGDWDGDGRDEIGLYREGGKVQRADGT
jgi:protocatechuate 3,4-dioxygenase beta subunit